MTVEESRFVQSLVNVKKNVKPKSDEFSAELERQLMQTIKSQAPAPEAEDPEITAFKEQLTSMGAAALFQHFNMEKIEKLLEEKRKELEKAFDVENLGGEEKAKALASIESILQDYAKELQERLAAKRELEDQKSPLASLLNS